MKKDIISEDKQPHLSCVDMFVHVVKQMLLLIGFVKRLACLRPLLNQMLLLETVSDLPESSSAFFKSISIGEQCDLREAVAAAAVLGVDETAVLGVVEMADAADSEAEAVAAAGFATKAHRKKL